MVKHRGSEGAGVLWWPGNESSTARPKKNKEPEKEKNTTWGANKGTKQKERSFVKKDLNLVEEKSTKDGREQSTRKNTKGKKKRAGMREYAWESAKAKRNLPGTKARTHRHRSRSTSRNKSTREKVRKERTKGNLKRRGGGGLEPRAKAKNLSQ